MAMTYEYIKQQLELIARETTDGANTAQRVGGALLDLLDYIYSQLAIVDSEAIQNALNTKADKAVVDLINRKVSCIVLIDGVLESTDTPSQEGTYLRYSSVATGHKLNHIVECTSLGVKGSTPLTTKVYVVADTAYIYDGDECKPIGGNASKIRQIGLELTDLKDRHVRFSESVKSEFEGTKSALEGLVMKEDYKRDKELTIREQQVINADLQEQINSIDIYDNFQKKAQ